MRRNRLPVRDSGIALAIEKQDHALLLNLIRERRCDGITTQQRGESQWDCFGVSKMSPEDHQQLSSSLVHAVLYCFVYPEGKGLMKTKQAS